MGRKTIIFVSFSESFIKENKYSNINDRLVKHCTALLNLLTCILNKNNTALGKKRKLNKLVNIYLQAQKYEAFIKSFTT